jgi:2-keto-4-pentenoate hydratase/2-oxohepta-3-ene-1,7-dioic acid hydratase in catechol pathway
MKLITFENKEGKERIGLLLNDGVLDLSESSNGVIPNNMVSFIENHEKYLPMIDPSSHKQRYSKEEIIIKSPLPRPVSVRDFYAFEEHVKTARAKRGLGVIPEWYEIPVFYFTNHLAIKGPDEAIERPVDCEWLDYELEIACVIGKQGKDISKDEAEDYIFGYCIMNDWSARDFQRQEMKVGLGPAKGKDFATSLGPYLVTKEELEVYKEGDRYQLEMTAKVNGRLLSKGNYEQIYYTFAEMIERASAGVTLYPGEVIGSGTVGTGCILELGTDVHRWLEPDDEIELEITGLGALKNTVTEGGV